MIGDASQGGAAPGWFEDPTGRHQHRYWDGTTWTPDVADNGQASVDPLDGPGGAAGTAQAAGTAAATDPAGERVLMIVPMATDVMWGGAMNLYITDRRIVVDKVMGSTAGAWAAGGVIGGQIAENVARERSGVAMSQGRSPEDVLRSSSANYAIDYASITHLRLTRKALPIGYSRCKITSTQKNALLAVKREAFDDVANVLRQVLPGRVEVK